MSDGDCRRFLCARDHNVEKAADMARYALDWSVCGRARRVRCGRGCFAHAAASRPLPPAPPRLSPSRSLWHARRRQRIQPDKIQPADISTPLAQGCWRFAGWARDGRAIVLIRAALWKPSAYSLEDYQKYVVSEKRVRSPPRNHAPPHNTMVAQCAALLDDNPDEE